MNTTITTPSTILISDDQQAAEIQEILSNQAITNEPFIIDELDVAKAHGFETVDEYRQHDFEDWIRFQEANSK